MIQRNLLVTALCLAALPCFAQTQPTPVPAQYPPGTVPIGRNPGDNSHQMERPQKSKKKKGEKPKAEQPTITAEGVTVDNNGKQIVVHTADGRWLTLTIDSETKWTQAGAEIKPDTVARGTMVKTEAAEDSEAYLTALTIELEKIPPPPSLLASARPAEPVALSDEAAREQAVRDEEARDEATDKQLTESKKPLDVPDAPDRPVLRHSKPKRSSTENSEASTKPEADSTGQQDFTIGEAKPVRPASAGGPGSDILQRSLVWAETFNHGLPNYICRQVTTRYSEQSHSDDWHADDVVTANIVYQDGHEDYKDVTVGSKKVTDITKTGGTWSTGEFASMLLSLFHPERETEFKYYRMAALHDEQAAIFDYKVALSNSDWRIIVGGQTLMPTYSGSIWVEKSTGVVRRMEQEAKNIPKDFPMDEIQSSVEYDLVSLGTAKFLLPVHAENISCQRATSYCTKNVIDFRDYHKYAGESTIEFK